MSVDKDLLLELTREILDIQVEKKKYMKDTNDRLKALAQRVKEAIKEEES